MSRFRKVILVLLVIPVCLVSGCFGDNDKSENATQPLVVEVTFPGPVGLTDSNEITLRGKASGTVPVAGVRINDQDATTDNNFATWQATVALENGPNVFSIEARNTLGEVVSADSDVTIERSWAIRAHLELFVSDSANSRAYILFQDDNIAWKRENFFLVTFDLAGAQPGEVLTAADGAVLDLPFLRYPEAMVLDASANRLLVADSYVKHNPEGEVPAGRRALLSVDLATGSYTTLSDLNLGTGKNLRTPVAMALDTVNNRVLLINTDQDYLDEPYSRTSLLVIDLTSGNRTAIASDFNYYVRDMVLDASNNRILVIEREIMGDASLTAVDLATGAKTIISDSATGTGTLFTDPVRMALDAAAQQVYVADTDREAVLCVDLGTGNRHIVSGDNTGQGPQLDFPLAIGMGTAGEDVLIAQHGALLNVALSSGDRTQVADYQSDLGSGPDLNCGNSGLFLDADRQRLLIITSTDGEKLLLAIDRTTGNRSVVSSTTTGSGPAFGGLVDVALDSDGQRALVIDRGNDALFSVDLTTGDRELVSGPAMGLDDYPYMYNMDLDPAGNRVLVTANGDADHALLAIDLNSGQRQAILSKPSDNSNLHFKRPGDIVIDTDNQRALWVRDELISYDLISGDTTAIASVTGKNWIDLDAANNRVAVLELYAFVLDDLMGPHIGNIELFELNLSDASSRTISDDSTGTGPLLRYPQHLALDPDNHRAFINDTDSIIVVDLTSGDRAMVSR